jgi:hypothetical protein
MSGGLQGPAGKCPREGATRARGAYEGKERIDVRSLLLQVVIDKAGAGWLYCNAFRTTTK